MACGAAACFTLMQVSRAQVVSPLHLNVNSLADTPDINAGDGLCDSDGTTNGEQCTLRAAIQEANAFAVAGADTITFDPALNLGTISLNSALPEIATNLIITGPGANLLRVQRSTAGGTPNFRVFKIRPDLGPSVTVTIAGLTIANGSIAGAAIETNSGGGIWNRGTLTIDSCVISGNQATAGGGIYNLGTLTITKSTIANNTTTDSGAGLVSATEDPNVVITVDGSTISENTTATAGGGIYNLGTAPVLITNTTISSNHAFQGAGVTNHGHLQLNAVTVTANDASSNSGGIRNGGTVILMNTILAGNTSPVGPDGAGLHFNSLDFNLIGNTADLPITGLVAHNLTNVDARLGPLAFNGGLTRTHELLDGSPAIDAGLSTLPTDQRGSTRWIDNPAVANATGGDASDIGAYETPLLFEVNSTADTSDGACTLSGTGNGCTLREAITAANAAAGAEVITLKASLTAAGPTSINLLTALPDLASDMTITGPGVNLLTVQRSTALGTPAFRIFNINAGRTVSISDLTIANGLSTGGALGGGVRNAGRLTLSNCNLYGNTAGPNPGFGLGGGIYTDGQSLVLNNCNVGGLGPNQPNQVGASGGGVFVESGTFVMTGGSLVSNSGDGVATRGTTTLKGVSITNNTENGNGGAGLLVIGGTTKIENCLIANNIANGGDGGGLRSGLGTITVVNTTFSGNRSVGSGGGVYNFNAQTSLTNVTATNNRSDSDGNSFGASNGGGVAGAVFIKNSIVTGNTMGSNASPIANDMSHAGDPSSSFNMIGVCDGCGLFNGFNNNQLGINNAGLGPLADNGGLTLTHALLAGSPALDAGSNALVAGPLFSGPPFTDQRGFNRIAAATVDIGAFEQQSSLSQIPDAVTNEDTELIVPFHVGDRTGITSITATSSNHNLVAGNQLKVTDAGSTELVTIKPATDQNGTTDITVTINTTGGNTSRTFTVTVNPVNDTPSFGLRVVTPTLEDIGPVTVSEFASNISPGPVDEAAQTVSFQVVANTNPSLFAVQPAINPAGNLTYTSAPDANGSASIAFVAKDNGGAANGGQDTSKPQTLTITVNPVNDAPVNLLPAQQSVAENNVLTFSAIKSNPIMVSDVDAGLAVVQVALSVNNGVLTLGNTAGLTFSVGDGTGDANMTFRGTIAAINSALNGTTYTPVQGFSGFSTLEITTDDLGASGAGAPFPDTDFLNIQVVEGGTLQFTSALYSANEDVIIAVVLLTRLGGSGGTTSVSFATANGTAVGGFACAPGVDYVNIAGTATWNDGDAANKLFTIPICNDSQNEVDETININLTTVTGSGVLGTPVNAVLTIVSDDAPVLLTEEAVQRAVALDSVVQSRDPFSLLNLANLSNDHRRRISLFAWRLGLLPTDTAANLTVIAEDDQGRVYPLTVEFVGMLNTPPDVAQINVILPDNVIGAPRDLWIRVQLRGPASNKASIAIASP